MESWACKPRCFANGRWTWPARASATAVEVGLRAGAGVHATRGRFAPFVAVAAELVPLPPSVFALPAGNVGHTPLFWIGATAGASLSFL